MKKLLYQGFLVGACLIALSACNVTVGGHTNGLRSIGVSQCNHIRNSGARAACEQGVAERDREKQQQLEAFYYQCGRHGHCDPNTYNSNRPSHRTDNVHQTGLYCIRPGVWAKDGRGVVKC